jgi:hypothetical protein
MLMFITATVIVLLTLSSSLSPSFLVQARPSEQERVELWHQSGNTWPPTTWQPETPRMRKAMAAREQEIMALTGSDERWENWIQYTQSRLVPKFTSMGFEVINAPAHIHQLVEAVNRGLANFDSLRSEGDVDVIYNTAGMDPKFVDVGDLAWEAIANLKPLHEEWGGMELVPTSAYGVRLYQNGSSLVMHYDRVSLGCLLEALLL